MIIRLKGADFSANNIGKIVYERILKDETRSLLSNYTKVLSEDQQFAVQDFLDGLKDAGIWSTIGNLYLPVLCGNISEALFNVKTSVLDGTFSSSYVLENNGVHPTDGTSITTIKYNGSEQNFHALAYPMQKITSFGSDEFIFGLNDYGYFYFRFGLTNSGEYVAGEKINGTNDVVFGKKNGVNNTPCLIGVINSTLGNMAVGLETTFGGTPIDTDRTFTDSNLAVLSAPHVKRTFGTPMGLISYGIAMSEEQIAEYNKLANTFMSYFI